MQAKQLLVAFGQLTDNSIVLFCLGRAKIKET
jgi:hypothetical protein